MRWLIGYRLQPAAANASRWADIMLTKEEVKKIIGIAMLFDGKKRFDNWIGVEAGEWAEMVAEAIVNLPNNASTRPASAGGTDGESDESAGG